MKVDKSGQRVQQMFGEIAPKYDRMNHLLSMNVDRYWRWKTVRKLAPNNTDPILDVCTGTGDLAFAQGLADERRAPGYRLGDQDAVELAVEKAVKIACDICPTKR